jgi:hypothetical protein
MSVIEGVVNKLRPIRPNDSEWIKAGRFPANTFSIVGKVIFAGGYGISEYNQPRNIMGGTTLRVEVFKVMVKGNDYIQLERVLVDVKKALNDQYVLLSGIEHIESKDEGFMELALTFKTN